MNTIKELAKTSGFSEVYIRRAVQKGALKTERVKFNENQFKHMISAKNWENWRNSRKSRSQRKDGRNKFLTYATPTELAELEALIAKSALKGRIQIVRANPPKAKAAK